MSVKRLWMASLTVLLALAGHAAAQGKNELAVLVGRTFISDKGVPGTNFFDNVVHSGNGLSFEGDYARPILGRDSFLKLSLEVPFVINPDEDLNYGQNVVPEQYASFFVTPSARLNIFADTAISPWVSFGGGFGFFKASDKLLFGGPNPGSTTATTGVFQIGGGLDVKVHNTISLRVEVRDFDSGVPPINVDTGNSRQHNLFVGGGVVFHF